MIAIPRFLPSALRLPPSAFAPVPQPGSPAPGPLPAPSGPNPDWTLQDFFDRYFLPVYLLPTQADPKTVAEYRSALERWTELAGRPPLGSIDTVLCAQFVARDMKTPGRRDGKTALSPNTVRKHCVHLQMILKLAGPAVKDCRFAASAYGLFGNDPYGRPRAVPFFPAPPPRDKPPEDGFTVEEIKAIRAAARCMEKPVLKECSAPRWWRAFLLVDYESALRIGTLLALRRSWIRRHGDDGCVIVPARDYKQGRPVPIYLPPASLRAIEALPTGELVFPWPETRRTLFRYRFRLLAAAGIPRDRCFGFHGFRKARGSELWKLDPRAAQAQLGHKDAATTAGHYANQEAQQIAAMNVVREAAEKTAPIDDDGPQQRLF